MVHHAVEQQVLTKFPGVVTEAEIHSLENLRGIPISSNPDIHLSKISVEWNDFFYEPFIASGTAPAKTQLLQKATEIDRLRCFVRAPSRRWTVKYFAVKPEVAGGFGPRTVIDRSSGRMVVTKLHYEFDGWLGDELLVSVPSFIVSERLGRAIEQAGLSGARLAPVEVTTTEQFRELYPDRSLPAFCWLKLEGVAGHDDFGLLNGVRLVVSQRALDLVRRFGIINARVTPLEESAPM